jgi:mono/diheme cytochrome c family protein
VLVACAALPAPAQEASSLQLHFGRQIYRLFCVGCHGDDGSGNGEVAVAFQIPVGDLTLIARRNGGEFPTGEVAAAIAGNSDVSGHKAFAMQPWAEMFKQEFERFAAEMAVNQLVSRRIDHLVEYLRSIQR